MESLYDIAVAVVAWVFHETLPLLGPIWTQF